MAMQQLRGPEPHTDGRQRTLFSMGFSHRKRTLDLQPAPLPQRQSAGFAEAMRQAAASVAGQQAAKCQRVVDPLGTGRPVSCPPPAEQQQQV